MNKYVAALCVAGTVCASASSATRAADIDVDIDITLGRLLILSCYDDLDVTLSGTELASALGLSGADGTDVVTTQQVLTPTFSGGELTETLSIGTDATSITPTVTMTLNNLCGVRAIGSSTGTVAVSVSSGNSFTLTNSGGGTIAASSVATTTATLTGVSLGTVSPFGVTMSLDLSSASASGLYDLNNAEFTVTASNS